MDAVTAVKVGIITVGSVVHPSQKAVTVEHYPTPTPVVQKAAQQPLPTCPSDPVVASYQTLLTPQWSGNNSTDNKQPGNSNANLDQVAGRAEQGVPCSIGLPISFAGPKK